MNQPATSLTVTPVPGVLHNLPEGEHDMTIIQVVLKVQVNRYGDKYNALYLTYASDNGLTASSMSPEFKGGIVNILSALHQPVLSLKDLTPEALMSLRGTRVRATVTHRAQRSVIYANVTAVNGVKL